MRKNGFLLILFLAVTGFVTSCKKTSQDFSPGAGDPRIIGTWQLVERRFPKDSTYKTPYYSTRPDTIITNRDTVYTTRPDTSYVPRDTSYYVTKRYPARPPQTLTFDEAGNLSANGSEMTYYYPIRKFRVETTFEDSLGVNLYVNTNGANFSFRQRVTFLPDTLVLSQRCDQPCYLKLVRVR